MLNPNDKIRKEKGITLIALIITVVVIVIIASIAISVAIGNNRLVNMSLIAKDENTKGIATETMNLKITNVEMSAYIEKHRLPTLKELADNFCEDDDFDKVVEKTEVASLEKITNENPIAIIAKLKQYPYEFEIDSNLRLIGVDGVKIAQNDEQNDQNQPGGLVEENLNQCTFSVEKNVITLNGVENVAILSVFIDGKYFGVSEKSETFKIHDLSKGVYEVFVIAIDEDGNVYRSQTQSININTIYLYDEGVVSEILYNQSYPSGFAVSGYVWGRAPGLQVNSNNFYMTASGDGNSGPNGNVYSVNSVDLTNYDYVYVEYDFSHNDRVNTAYAGVATSINSWDPSAASRVGLTKGTKQTAKIPVSDLQNSYKIYFTLGGYANCSAGLRIYKIWIE